MLENRGSLYRLINRTAAGEILDRRRRLRMALDVVCYFAWYLKGKKVDHDLQFMIRK